MCPRNESICRTKEQQHKERERETESNEEKTNNTKIKNKEIKGEIKSHRTNMKRFHWFIITLKKITHTNR